GGFSAATAMIILSSMTLSTMVTNHLFMPLISSFKQIGFLRRYLLPCRWMAIAMVILSGYLFEKAVGESYLLVSIGIMSFAAVLQFAPAIIGGLYWRRGNKPGALMGMSAGFGMWIYTQLIPAFVRNGWLSPALLTDGPWGLKLMAPERFLGVTGLDPVTYTVFWTMLVNAGLYVIGALYFKGSDQEQRLAEEFVTALRPGRTPGAPVVRQADINLSEKKDLFEKRLAQYFPSARAKNIVDDCIMTLGLAGKEWISITELAELNRSVERSLAGSIGAAAAHSALPERMIFSLTESLALSDVYARMLAELRVPPEELKRRIDYHQEREALLNRQAEEMATQITEREREIVRRQEVEQALRESEERYRTILETAPNAITLTRLEGGQYLEANQAFCRITGYPREEVLGKTPFELNLLANPEDRQRLIDELKEKGELIGFELQYRKKDGTIIDALLSARGLRSGREDCLLVVGTDITARKQAEVMLKESEEKYRNLFTFAPVGIAITTIGGRVLSYNDAFLKMFKYDDKDLSAGMNARDFYRNSGTGRMEMLNKLMAEGQLENYQEELFDSTGKGFPASLSLRVIQYEGQTCIQSIIRDITEIKKLESALMDYAENLEMMVDRKTRELKAANEDLSAVIMSLEETREKLAVSAHQAGMAELAVSILHNIGNAINSINVRLSRLDGNLSGRDIISLEKIHNLLQTEEMIPAQSPAQADRRGKLIKYFDATIASFKENYHRMRGDHEFMKRGLDHVIETISLQQKYAGIRGSETPENLNDLLRDALDMLMDSIKKRGIAIEFQQNPVPQVMINRNRMVQILINIIKNSYEAIDQTGRTTDHKINLSTTVENEDGRRYVQIVIADTGVGGTPDVMIKAFRFNFSTKGRGSGFGLHDAANYINAQNGSINMFSEGPGQGTRMVIRLPIPKGEHGGEQPNNSN
ncbi:MAG: PAS domain S-box protein, partial [Deltaproteobacteria bacterium]|nr:PAS domain S-box protein [Deltaproteobacteria bacterium]